MERNLTTLGAQVKELRANLDAFKQSLRAMVVQDRSYAAAFESIVEALRDDGSLETSFAEVEYLDATKKG